MSALAALLVKIARGLGSFFTSRTGRSMARALYAVLVFGTLCAVFEGRLAGTSAATVLVALVTGLGAAWVSGKLAGPQGGPQ